MAIHKANLGAILGLNNRLSETQLDVRLPGGARSTYLYGAENVDLNDKQALRRRRGKTLALAGRAHSLWSDKRSGYAVIDDVLWHLAPAGSGLSKAQVRAGMPSLPMSYSRGADGDVYWSNGAQIRRVSNGVDKPVVTDPLPHAPTVLAEEGGGLPAGRYLVVFTVTGPDGESPATPNMQVVVPDNGRIVIGPVPVAAQVYLSGPNGDVPTLASAVPTAGTTIFTLPAGGIRCATINTATAPPGAIVRHYNGTMLVAAGNLVCWSKPWNYGVFDLRDYIAFPAPVSLIEPLDGGVFIAADQTYWISDFLGGSGLQAVLPFGAVPGSSGQSPETKEAFWHSPEGLVIGGEGGAVKVVQRDALAFGDAASGASLYRRHNGITQILTSRFGVEASVAVASSFMDAEIVRKGTIL